MTTGSISSNSFSAGNSRKNLVIGLTMRHSPVGARAIRMLKEPSLRRTIAGVGRLRSRFQPMPRTTRAFNPISRAARTRSIFIRQAAGQRQFALELTRVGGDAVITGDAHDRPKAGVDRSGNDFGTYGTIHQ